MTSDQFRAWFPEFGQTPETQVQGAIDRAALEVDATTWGTTADTGIGLLTAHYLSLSPAGKTARLQSEKGKSTYLEQFQRLQIGATTMIRVL